MAFITSGKYIRSRCRADCMISPYYPLPTYTSQGHAKYYWLCMDCKKSWDDHPLVGNFEAARNICVNGVELFMTKKR